MPKVTNKVTLNSFIVQWIGQITTDDQMWVRILLRLQYKEGIWLDEEPLLKSGRTCNGSCGFESHFLLKIKMEVIRLDEELLLKSSRTCNGSCEFESHNFRKWRVN